jgi:hypothetical protein
LRYRIGSLALGVALALSTTLLALAQAEDDASPTDDAVDTTLVAPATDATLVLHVLEPAEQEVEVPLTTTELTLRGTTVAGAVVSIDGDLVEVDAEGGFSGLTPLEEGANAIDVVASDAQGNQVTTTLVVVRGD